ncbi:MAG: RdgB/HAM1 family non-canonical purine NTP pyrophosphatase [Acholeplasmataceae bacterium]|nr:RdgB/HAM1 family non-canonical purine NTP pyrophosphatase [Acholeplasmataceae bacterium]
MSMEILLVTKNENKVKEIKEALKGKDYKLITLSDLSDLDEVEEIGLTFKENAFIKAKYYADKYHKVVLSDDSGLEVFSLEGRPGVHSNRYAKTQTEANQKLIEELKGKDSHARFVTVMCLYNPFTKEAKYYKGILKGKIINSPRGTNGFGYDPIFLLPNNKTLAELTLEEKVLISHRSIALEKLRSDL